MDLLVWYDSANLVPDSLFDQGECLADVSTEVFRERVVNRLEKFKTSGNQGLTELLGSLKNLQMTSHSKAV